MEIKKGSIVKIEYTGTLDDGKVFDTCKGREPLEFEVGAGKVIKGFEAVLLDAALDHRVDGGLSDVLDG